MECENIRFWSNEVPRQRQIYGINADYWYHLLECSRYSFWLTFFNVLIPRFSESLNGIEYTEKSDVYSFGVILWEIFHRKNPFQGLDPVAAAIDVISGIRPEIASTVPPEIIEMITACWDQDPDKRPTFERITDILKSLSIKNPMYSMGHQRSIEAPTGLVYLVQMV